MIATELVISQQVLQDIKMTAQELAVEIAVYLYEKRRFSIGQAKRLCGLDHISFQKALAQRNLYIHYDMEDVKEYLKNLGISL